MTFSFEDVFGRNPDDDEFDVIGPPAQPPDEPSTGVFPALPPTKYGRREDGTPRNPWRSQEDARALGYANTADFRRSRGEALGLSPAAARGHARVGEATATDLRVVGRLGADAQIDVLRRVALLNARLQLADRPPIRLRRGMVVQYDEATVSANIDGIDNPQTLYLMATLTGDEWAGLARFGVPGNPWFYH